MNPVLNAALGKLPEALQSAISTFLSSIHEIEKDNLSTVVIYGGIARGKYNDGTSDVNIMIVFREVTISTLQNIRPLLEQATLASAFHPFILSQKDIASAASLFPEKFLDIQQYHILLYGEDILTELSFSKLHLLRNCRRELKNLLLRFTYQYIQSSGNAERLQRTVADITGSLFINLNTLTYLKTGVYQRSRGQVIKDFAAAFPGTDIAAAEKLVSLKSLPADQLISQIGAIAAHTLQQLNVFSTLADAIDESI